MKSYLEWLYLESLKDQASTSKEDGDYITFPRGEDQSISSRLDNYRKMQLIKLVRESKPERDWRQAAAKDHGELVAEIKARYGVDLADTRVRILNQPVYSDGRSAPKHDASSLGSSAHAAARPFVAIRPRLDFERVMHNYGLGTAEAPLSETRIAAMRRYIHGHELLHSVEARLADAERVRLLKLISASGFETDYTKINPEDKERVVEYMAAEMGLDTWAKNKRFNKIKRIS